MALASDSRTLTPLEQSVLGPESIAMVAKFNNNPVTQTPLYVQDINDPAPGRKVYANFKFPEVETIDTVFPHILVEYAGLEIDHSREHRGDRYLQYTPVGMTTGGPYKVMNPTTGATEVWDPINDSYSPLYVSEWPLPYNIDFDITVNCRYRNHLTQLINQLIQIDYLPDRFGYLIIPEDSTVRSLFLLGGPEMSATGSDQDDKRLFTARYKVRIATELLSTQVSVISNYITSINATTTWKPISST